MARTPKPEFAGRDSAELHRLADARRREDQATAEAWRAARLAEAQTLVNSHPDGRDIPECVAAFAEAQAAIAPIAERWQRAFAARYPQEIFHASLTVGVIPGGIFDAGMKKQVFKEAEKHIEGRYRHKLAIARAVATEREGAVTLNSLASPVTRGMAEKWAEPAARTFQLEPPGPALGALAQLLPDPAAWELDDSHNAVLPAPAPQRLIAHTSEADDDE